MTRARTEMERRMQASEVEREQALAIAEQDRQIAVFAKSREESHARVEAEQARAGAITAAEVVETARGSRPKTGGRKA